jgi:hypothetical protein
MSLRLLFLIGLLAGLLSVRPLHAKDIVLKGRVTEEVWATVVSPPKGKEIEYLKLEDGRRVVAYVSDKILCAGPLLLRGKMIPIRVKPEKGSKLEGEVFTDEHLDVSSWECLGGSEVLALVLQLGDFRVPIEQKREIRKKIVAMGKEAIPTLISRLDDRRIYERDRDIQNYYALPPFGKKPVPIYTNITVGEICNEMLYEVITPKYQSPYSKPIKPSSFQMLSVRDWKAWWEKNKSKSLDQIHEELKPLVDRYWKEKGNMQGVP